MKYLSSLLLLLLLQQPLLAKDNVVNFYNWTGYVPNSILVQFTKETGIKVNFATFASNDELYAKVATSNNHSGYDVIVPSANFVQRMRREGMLQHLDKSRLPNIKNINPHFLNKPFDPGNEYSIPYFWGATGIIANRHYYPHLQLKEWHDLWQTKLKNKILMLDEVKEPFEIALRVLQLPSNTQNKKNIQRAYHKLLQLLPNIKLFNIVAPSVILSDGDINIGVVYNGDAYQAIQKNPQLVFIYPNDGAFIWIDNMVIPKNAPHLKNAYTLINFLLRPEIAAKIALAMNYSTPNQAALQLMPHSVRNNKVLYPNNKILAKASFEQNLGTAEKFYQHYWQLLKLSS